MTEATAVPGYTITGVAGIGGTAAVLRGRSEAGRDVVLHTAPEAPAGLVRRARVAQQVQHPGVAPVLDLVDLAGGGFAVASAFVPGPTLATLRAARRGLTTAECVRVVTELLGALETLHAAGIVHGDVSPANVVVTPTEADAGRLVLVDLVGGAEPDRGTRGFRAPELDQGAPASAAADVYSAAQVGLWVAEAASRREVAEVLEPMVAAGPRQRPSAHRALELLDGVASAPVGLAPAEALASATLREHAAREPTTRARLRRPRVRHRHRARGRRGLRRAAAAVAAVGVLLAAVRLLGQDPADGVGQMPAAAGETEESGEAGQPATERSEDGAASDARVAAAVRDLLAARDEAIGHDDVETLTALTVPGSPLAQDDAELLANLTAAGVQLRGYSTEILDLEVLDSGPEEATVQVRLRQRAHERARPDGSVIDVPAQPAQCLELTVEPAATTGAWRAATAGPC